MANMTKTLLTCISYPCLSRVWGKITKIKTPKAVVRKTIAAYASHYKIDMSEYIGKIEDYESVSDFFIRPLNPETRPLKKVEGAFLSPSDGVLSALELITSDTALQAKGITYKVTEFLKDTPDLSKGYYLMTIYLSPKNYHRFHSPADCVVDSSTHAGCRLFPVNKRSVGNVDELFIKNERIIAKLNIKNNIIYFVAVGASFVGSIKMEFDHPDKPQCADGWHPVKIGFSQMQELGRFEMGSTIVLAVPAAMVGTMKLEKGQEIRTGDIMFTVREQ